MLEDLPLDLDRDSAQPLSVQIADQVRRAATTGPLRGGDRLPSTRALAERLGVSRTVVAAAYDQLHAEGWITGRRGSGTYLTTAPAAAPARAAAGRDTAPPPRQVDRAPGAPCVDAL
ncbi:winged helix-turn-helix domain-containing protein, partial [Nocardia gipuzkoensis]|uniref:winged helix-turn-helix domain-containing protein n=1 Tax=Nocardia gipuzkoensis TaxID=2749991 RepID=UPI0024569004